MRLLLKTHGLRIVLGLAALTSYALVLEAGRRWC